MFSRRALLVNISIHALRVEGDLYRLAHIQKALISIHALRVEGDEEIIDDSATQWISIHALRVEGDPARTDTVYGRKRFLSTPSGWRAT